jgi:membrane fusion protein (multidrug efflux system)
MDRRNEREAEMAASGRDQAARVIRPEDAASENDAQRAEAVSKLENLRARSTEPEARRTGDAAAEAPTVDAPAAPAKSGRRRKVLTGIGAIAALAAIYAGYYYFVTGRYMVSTDDAYVRSNNTTLGARVSGHIEKIAIGDNTRVKAGDLLFQIDDGDYRIAVENARAKIATQEATIERIGRQAVAQESAVEQAKAQLASADAATKRAEADFTRQQTLTDRGFASKATFDVAQAARDQAVASVQGAQATLDAAEAQVGVIKSQQAEAKGQLNELKTALEKAERDLSFTTIRAPVDGVFSNRLVNEGDFIQPGQRLANVVPLDGVYIDANFKETQVARLKPGQRVKISVDAISGRTITGTVDSIAPASGSVFTLLPPDNATGNFTKIVQRLPVRIRIPASVAKENMLRAGMSVVVSVNTKPSPDGVDPIAAR